MASATSQSISHLSPRHSATDSFISEATFDSYCYITDTFTLANQRKTGVHPGVGPEIFSHLKYFLSCRWGRDTTGSPRPSSTPTTSGSPSSSSYRQSGHSHWSDPSRYFALIGWDHNVSIHLSLLTSSLLSPLLSPLPSPPPPRSKTSLPLVP